MSDKSATANDTLLFNSEAIEVNPVPPLETASVPVRLFKGNAMSAEPSKDTPAIVRAVANVVAVVALPTKPPSKVEATNVPNEKPLVVFTVLVGSAFELPVDENNFHLSLSEASLNKPLYRMLLPSLYLP